VGASVCCSRTRDSRAVCGAGSNRSSIPAVTGSAASGPYAGFLRGRPRRLGADDFLDVEPLGRPRRRGAAAFGVDAVVPLGRPRRGLRAPATRALACAAHRSLTKLPREVLIETVSVAGLPHSSHTRIVCSAIDSPQSVC
jgi:hypothetical protein